MPGIITTGAHPKALWPGVKDHFGQKYNEWNVEYLDLFDKETSKQSYEEYVEVVELGYGNVKAEGASVAYDGDRQGYISRLTNVTYALGYIVTMEELQDNLYAKISKRRSGALAFSMRQTKEVVGANYYNRAFTGGAYVGGDGVALLSTAHPTQGGQASNKLAVDADLSEAALEDMLIQIAQARDNRGLRVQISAQNLIIPPQLMFVAERLTKSAGQPGTANNDLNATRSMGMLPGGFKVNHYLTDPDAWFIRTQVPNSGMIYQERMKLAFTKDNDFDTENAKAKAVERYTFGWGDWRGLFGSAGA